MASLALGSAFSDGVFESVKDRLPLELRLGLFDVHSCWRSVKVGGGVGII